MSERLDEKIGRSESSLDRNQEIPVENNDTLQDIVQVFIPEKPTEAKSELVNVIKSEIPDLNIELHQEGLYSNPPLPQSPSLAVQAEITGPLPASPTIAGSSSADIVQHLYKRPNTESEIQGKDKLTKYSFEAEAASAIPLAVPMPLCRGMTVIPRVMEVGQSSGKKMPNAAMGLPTGHGTTNITPMTVRGNGGDGNSPTRTERTTGSGGRTVEGFLYESKAGAMFIVCTCHGVFLTLDEFVKHAGGPESPNPIRHITISPVDE